MSEHLAMDDVLAGYIFLSLLFRILFEIYVCNIFATQHFGCQFQHENLLLVPNGLSFHQTSLKLQCEFVGQCPMWFYYEWYAHKYQ